MAGSFVLDIAGMFLVGVGVPLVALAIIAGINTLIQNARGNNSGPQGPRP